jgi:integrase/recombinase XerC
MSVRVEFDDGVHLLAGAGADVELANRFLAHLSVRGFAPATRRAYAYDLLNFLRFLDDAGLGLVEIVPTDLFDYLEWQGRRPSTAGRRVVRLDAARGAAPATMNRRVAAVRGLFDYAVLAELVERNPVPAARRTTSPRGRRRGLLAHVPSRPRTGGRLVRQPRRLPESLAADEVAAFLADLRTCRDRAIALLMLLGGLRSAEVRSLRLADVDQGRRRVRVVGKGGKERVVPVDGVFFAELAAYLARERPPGVSTPECFVVLRGPTTGQALTEAGLRKIFRSHRAAAGAGRVRPHRLRHTYGTELAAAGMDLLVLRELMGHASPETTAGYVHLTIETLAAEYTRAREGQP